MIDGHVRLLKCDIDNPSCKELVSHVDLHWQMPQVPLIRYLVPLHDKEQSLAPLKWPYGSSVLDHKRIYDYYIEAISNRLPLEIKDHSEGDHKEARDGVKVEQTNQHLTSRTIKRWIDDKTEDRLLLLIDSAGSPQASRVEQAFYQLAALLKEKKISIKTAIYDLDKNTKIGLNVKSLPAIRLYKKAYVRSLYVECPRARFELSGLLAFVIDHSR